MGDDVNTNRIIVTCHSGYTYPEYPTSFDWEGRSLKVDRIIAEWQSPGEKHFKVLVDDNQVFDLIYRLNDGNWIILLVYQ